MTESIKNGLIIAFVVGGIGVYGSISSLFTRVNKLEADEMTREVIELTLHNIEDKLDVNSKKSDRFYKKLEEHIKDTK